MAKNNECGIEIADSVIQRIRQHARSSMRAEICGVLIGHVDGDKPVVDALIQGEKADEAGSHVTFTQQTWEHIYKIKDKEYPEKAIVGWYHSHPGFGVFLSDHDLFIHENFFNAPHQVAWVFDPHSDEEGCFGWRDGKIARLRAIKVLVEERNQDVSQKEEGKWEGDKVGRQEGDAPARRSWVGITLIAFAWLVVVFLSFVAGIYFSERHLQAALQNQDLVAIPKPVLIELLQKSQISISPGVSVDPGAQLLTVPSAPASAGATNETSDTPQKSKRTP